MEKKQPKQKDFFAKENPKANDDENNYITAHDVIEIPDGKTNGTLINIQRRISELYDYVDIYFEITVEGGKVTTIKTGYPSNISAKSGLGDFLKMCGIDVVAEQRYNLNEIKEKLYGTVFSFTVIHESTAKGKFARIVNSTIAKIN